MDALLEIEKELKETRVLVRDNKITYVQARAISELADTSIKAILARGSLNPKIK